MQFVMNISHVICHQKLTRLVVGDKIKAAMSSVFLCFVLCVLFFLVLLYNCTIEIWKRIKNQERYNLFQAFRKWGAAWSKNGARSLSTFPRFLYHFTSHCTPYLEKAPKDEGMKVRSFRLRIQPSKGLIMVLVQICIYRHPTAIQNCTSIFSFLATLLWLLTERRRQIRINNCISYSIKNYKSLNMLRKYEEKGAILQVTL